MLNLLTVAAVAHDARSDWVTRRTPGSWPRSVGLLLVVALAIGCGQRAPEAEIVLPTTTVLTTGQQWGVVTSEFLRVRESAVLSAEILSYLRRGEVIEVLGRSDRREQVEGESEYWYHVSHEGVRGWAYGAYIGVTHSRDSAIRLLVESDDEQP